MNKYKTIGTLEVDKKLLGLINEEILRQYLFF